VGNWASGRPLKRMMSLYKYPGPGQLEGHKSYGPNTNFMTHPQTICSFSLSFFSISHLRNAKANRQQSWELETGDW